MIQLPNNISARDVEQWLNSGWFFGNEDNQYIPLQLTGFNRAGSVVAVTAEGRRLELKKADVFPHWPKCGAINLEGFAVILTRKPLKQWRRTYNSRQLTLSVPRRYDAAKKFGHNARGLSPNSPTVVQAAFNPHYPTPRQALALVESGKSLSVAVNPHLILLGGPGKGECEVLYNGDVSARIIRLPDGDYALDGVEPGDHVAHRIVKYMEGEVIINEGT